MRKVFRYFIQGLIVFIPVIITIAVLAKLFDYFVMAFSVFGITNSTFINTIFGFTLTVGFVLLLGFLTSSFIFREVFSFIEEKLEHAPFIRHIYSPVKDFTNAFMGSKKRFNKPVMVLTNPQAQIHEMGFITRESLDEFDIKDRVAVYMPLSYSLSGKLIIVLRDNVKPLNADASDTMKFIVSGGVTDVD